MEELQTGDLSVDFKMMLMTAIANLVKQVRHSA